MQEQWSCKESKGSHVRCEFTVDLVAKTASAHIHNDNENKGAWDNIEIEPGRTFAGFGFTLALSNLRKYLINGEQIELKAVGLMPPPLLKPMLATVKIFLRRSPAHENGGPLLPRRSIYCSPRD
jgi:hypothetical protein